MMLLRRNTILYPPGMCTTPIPHRRVVHSYTASCFVAVCLIFISTACSGPARPYPSSYTSPITGHIYTISSSTYHGTLFVYVDDAQGIDVGNTFENEESCWRAFGNYSSYSLGCFDTADEAIAMLVGHHERTITWEEFREGVTTTTRVTPTTSITTTTLYVADRFSVPDRSITNKISLRISEFLERFGTGEGKTNIEEYRSTATVYTVYKYEFRNPLLLGDTSFVEAEVAIKDDAKDQFVGWGRLIDGAWVIFHISGAKASYTSDNAIAALVEYHETQ